MSQQLLPAKPIFLAKIYFSDNSAMSEKFHQISLTQQSLQGRMSEYHVIMVPIVSPQCVGTMDFECFYPHEFDLKTFEDFKEEIKNEFLKGEGKDLDSTDMGMGPIEETGKDFAGNLEFKYNKEEGRIEIKK